MTNTNTGKKPDLENLERYYKVNRQHLQWSFWSSLAALSVGLGALLIGVWIALTGNSSITAILTIVGGVLTQFISAGFFFLYSRNLTQLNVFYGDSNRVTSSRAVAQIILAMVLGLRYKDGKDNN